MIHIDDPLIHIAFPKVKTEKQMVESFDTGRSFKLIEHLLHLINDPYSQTANHWVKEVNSYLDRLDDYYFDNKGKGRFPAKSYKEAMLTSEFPTNEANNFGKLFRRNKKDKEHALWDRLFPNEFYDAVDKIVDRFAEIMTSNKFDPDETLDIIRKYT